MSDVVKLAQELIRIPGYVELEEKETRTAEYLCGELQKAGLDARLADAGEGRYNVECVIRGKGGGKSLLLSTHLDTVPAYGMPDAFSPYVRDGRLYGRGAVDVKGILAAMACAVERIKNEGIRLLGDVVFLAVADEESGSLGMRAAMETAAADCDIAVIGEATHLNLGVAHKGVAWMEVAFKGKSTHGSTPELGVNAVVHACSFVERIRCRLTPVLDERTYPMLGRSTVNIGVIEGGTKPTIVPDSCRVRFDRRLLPGESTKTAQEEIRDILEEMKKEFPKMRYELKVLLGTEEKPFPPMSTESGQELVGCLAGSVEKQTGGTPELIGLPFWTDGALFGYGTGRPVVVFGPGMIEQAHSDMEFVDVLELEASSDIYYQMILDICGQEVAE